MKLPKNRRIVGAERAQLADALAKQYAGGESIRLIALNIGRSYGFVHRLLEEAGAKLHHRGGDTRAPQAPATVGADA
ncbi:helix-turn-helix domain-containing protein [Nonomuraea maheshkhaliensis]|uniref:Helix-turn-helix domain-containing protein n=1 Tax=Nonomuraea maheshkhaliensis TaxID=419590 RepID=A0ABP4R3H3_9ACTN